MVTRARCVAALAALSASLAACGGTSPQIGGGVGEMSQQPTPVEGSPSVLFRSASGPTTCTVYGPGHATQIIFESPQLDVRAECQLWSANESGAGYLWGYRADALPNATRLCSLTNPKRNLTATVIEESESLPISPDERARGVSACNNILASGWTPYRRL